MSTLNQEFAGSQLSTKPQFSFTEGGTKMDSCSDVQNNVNSERMETPEIDLKKPEVDHCDSKLDNQEKMDEDGMNTIEENEPSVKGIEIAADISESNEDHEKNEVSEPSPTKDPKKNDIEEKEINDKINESSEDQDFTDSLEKAGFKTTSSQTSTKMVDAMCQTIQSLSSSLKTLDAAVQTVESHYEDGYRETSVNRTRRKNDIKEELEEKDGFKQEKDGEKEDRTEESDSRVTQLLEYSEQNKVKDEFPCKVCKKLFSSIFSIKTHIYVAHRKYLKPAQAGAVVKKTGADYKKGFKSKNAYLTRKKFTHRKQKPWCKYCWVRFPNRVEYEEHRRQLHPEKLGVRERSTSAANSEISESSSAKSRMDLSSSKCEGDLISDISLGDQNSDTCLSNRTSRSNTPAVGNKSREGDEEEEDADDDDDEDDEDDNDMEILEADLTDPEVVKGLIRGLDVKVVKVDETLNLESRVSYLLNPTTEEDVSALKITEELELSDFMVSLPWYEARYHHCLICEKFYTLGAFSSHVLDAHGMSMVLYREKFPSDDLSVKLWNCSLCEKELKWTQSNISKHLKSMHCLSLQEYSLTILGTASFKVKQVRTEPSLPWYESRTHRCRICDHVFIFSELRKHLRLKHNCSFSNYKLLFPLSSLSAEASSEHPAWKCMICSAKTAWTKESIIQHIRKHNLSLESYAAEHVEDAKQDEENVEDSQLLPPLECVLNVKDEPEEEKSDVNSRIVRLEPRDSTPMKKSMPREMVKVGSDEKLWVPWFESKLHKCLICGEVRTCGLSFKNHIYDKHQYMSRKQYVKRFPGVDIEPDAWNCPLCHNTIKWTKKCIVDHLKTVHMLSREEFESTFNIPSRHKVDAPEGGEFNFNARTELGIANKEVAEAQEAENALQQLAESGSVVQCGICDDMVKSLMTHIEDYHKMSKDAYLKICVGDAKKFSSSPAKSKEKWSCQICEEETENTEKSIKEHLEIHAIDLKDYEKTFDIPNGNENESKEVEDDDEIVLPDSEIMMEEVEDEDVNIKKEVDTNGEESKEDNVVLHRGSPETPWFESIKMKCKECDVYFWLGAFMKHIIQAHRLPIKVYKVKYPETVIPKRQYTCRICGVSISHYASPISGHLTGRHNITMTDYYNKYEKMKVKPPSPLPESEIVIPSNTFPDDYLSLDSTSSKAQRMAEYHKTGKLPWFESKITICRICNEEWLLGSFRRHLYDRHDKISRTTYSEMFPDSDISIPTWRCKICGNGIKWVRDNIFYHLRTHNFTMEGYRQLYIDGSDDKTTALGKQMPNLVPITNSHETKEEKQFRCKLCNVLVSLESSAIRNHLKTFHNMSINEYQPFKNSPNPTAFSSAFPLADPNNSAYNIPLYTNPMIQKPPPLLKKILPRPSAPPAQPGLPWYNKCKWTCMLCNKAFSSGFWRHVSESHSYTKENYLQEFGKNGIDIVHYFCKICNKKIPWSGASINAHTKADHAMSLKEYEGLYGPKSDELVPDPQAEPDIPILPINMFPHLPSGSQIHYVHSPNKWFNGCEYKCQLCGRTLHSVAGLSMHLKDTHMMDKFSYFRQFGRAGINIRKYKCKVCFKSFPWSGVSISKHVKQTHNISLQRYSNMYENGSTQESIYQEELASGVPGMDPIRENQPPPSRDKGLKWYNKCSWTCQICGTTISTNSSAFYKHIAQDHGVPIDEYKEKHGNTGFVYVDHTCKLCNKKVPFNGLAMCKHFKHTHNMQLEEYQARFMIDDDGSSTGEYYAPTDEHWYNKGIWKCQICKNKNKSLGSYKKHIQKMHNMHYEDYFDKFGNAGIHEVVFRCKMCAATMSCNGVTIASHLLNNHKFTLAEYEKTYLKDGEDVGEEGIEVHPQDGEHFLAGMKATSSEPGPVLSKEEMLRKDKPWYQKCKYFCQICNNPYFSISALRNHTKVKHNMDRDTYVGIYGLDAGRVIEDYSCKICNRTLKCEGRSLNAHMRNCHKMGIVEYSKRYESQRNTQEDPNYYNETYQIELENDEGLEVEEDYTVESIGVEDNEDPLASFVSTEVLEDDYAEDDMTAEESLHFNFEEEEEDEEQPTFNEDIGVPEMKPDISKIQIIPEAMETEDDSVPTEESIEITSITEDNEEDEIDMSQVNMGVVEFSPENPLA